MERPIKRARPLKRISFEQDEFPKNNCYKKENKCISTPQKKDRNSFYIPNSPRLLIFGPPNYFS